MAILTRDLIVRIKASEPYHLDSDTIIDPGQSIIEFDSIDKTVTFNNVTFDKPVTFQNIDCRGSMSFYGCKFKGGILFKNCKIKINPNIKSTHSLFFYDCSFGEEMSIRIMNQNSFDSSVEIEGTIGLKKIILLESSFSTFYAKNSSFSNFEADNNTFGQELRLENCTLESQIRQSSNSYGMLVWMNSTFKKDIFLKDNELVHAFSIQDNIFLDEVRIDPYSTVVSDSALTVVNNQFKKSFQVSYYKKINEHIWKGGAEEIYIVSNKFDHGLTIIGDETNDNLIHLKKININISNNFEGLLKINHFKIENLFITGENYKGNVILKYLNIKNLFVLNFANYSSFQFIRCRALTTDSTFKIHESHLEKLQFTGCFLESFGKYDIEYSNLSLIKSSNTSWFNFKQLEKSKKINSLGNLKVKKSSLKNENSRVYQELRDIFRQLKYAMEQQGDKVNALTFKSHEMEAYHNFVKLNFSRLHRDRLILFLGKTNDHGINWQKPILFIFCFTFLFYVVLLFDESQKYHIYGKHFLFIEFLKDFWMNKKILPQLLNPIHKLEDLFPQSSFYTSGWAYSADFLYKIIFSFFVFQLISAFRKFVK